MDYLPLTLPLVDVRHALGGLETQGALAPTQVSGILRAFKRMGHEVRTLRALLALVRTEARTSPQCGIGSRTGRTVSRRRMRAWRCGCWQAGFRCPPPGCVGPIRFRPR